MAMTYGKLGWHLSIDRPKDKRDKLSNRAQLMSNLATVLGLLQASEDFYEKNKVEQLLQDSLIIAQSLKG